MRRQRLLRNGSSTQSLCIFCASRFLQSGLPPTTAISRRRLNTTRAPYQSAAAAAVQPDNGNESTIIPPSANGPQSTLTAAEQREKEYRKQQHAAAEQERLRQHREVLERQHAAQQAARQKAEQQRLRDSDAREAAAREDSASRAVGEHRASRPEASGGAGLDERSWYQHPTARTPNRRENVFRRIDDAPNVNYDSAGRSNRPVQNSNGMQNGKPASRQDEKQTQQGDGFRIRGRSNFSVRPDEQRTRQEFRTNRQPGTSRMSMPEFGVSSNDQQTGSSLEGGWGSGSAEAPPLEYGEEEQRLAKEAELRSQEPTHREFPSRAAPETSSTIADVFPGLNLDAGDRSRRFGSGGYARRGPSINQDNFWSSSQVSDPPPPPPLGRYANSSGAGDIGDTGYRATPFNPTEEYYSATYKFHPANADSNDTWSHLRQKGMSNAPPSQESPPPNPFQQPPPQRPLYRQSQQDIDRNFRDYQTQRAHNIPRMRAPPTGAFDNPFAQNGDDLANRAQRTCARCLKMGHSARECTAPPEEVRAKCNFCGTIGHMQAECPAKKRQTGTASSVLNSRSLFRRTSSTSRDDAPFAESAETKEPPRQAGGVEWRPLEEAARQAEPTEEDAEALERRARRSRRGFEVEEDTVEPRTELRERRKSRRSMERADDEHVDEANALREERAARRSARKAARRQAAESTEHQATPLMLPELISVSQLAQVLNVRYERLLERLEREGYDDIFPGKILNMETSGMIAMEYNFEPQFEYDSAIAREEQERDLKPRPELADKSLLPTRPPVVTIMGHVDHGKTTILDFLRKSSVAAGEAGGITQHIGAFSVPMSSSGRTITFLDTPGHAAFLAMRQRGANVTDVVVLVVAADDSVKPQTLESLRCAREAGVPILVAINKVDKEGADVQRVKQDLAKHGIEIEDFGGDVQTVSVSGKTGEGMAEFEEAIATLSEILDHRAEIDGNVEGWVLEATTKSHGRVATVLVKRGTLRVGQIIVAGKTWARVRSLKNENGHTLKEVGPGMPVEVDGWKEQATAGDQVLQAPSEQKASSVVLYRTEVADREKANEDMEVINESRRLEQEKRAREKAAEEAEKRGITSPENNTATAMPEQQDESTTSGQMTIPFIIKADVSGSAEAVAAYIPSLTSPLIAPQILSSGVGPVNESDIEYASTAQGHIIAFNLPQNNEALGMAESKGVKILENDVIYRTLDQVKEVLEAKLPRIVTQRVLGEAEVAAGFEIGLGGRKRMRIAGCKVRNGVVGMKNKVRVLRGGVGGEKVYDGVLTSLKNVKKDAQEMRKGTECGMGFESWEGFEVGDVVQTYEEISEKRRL